MNLAAWFKVAAYIRVDLTAAGTDPLGILSALINIRNYEPSCMVQNDRLHSIISHHQSRRRPCLYKEPI